jgi:hypothetical protein
MVDAAIVGGKQKERWNRPKERTLSIAEPALAISHPPP